MSKESNSIYDEIKEQDKSIKKLPLKKKFSHIWRYYKWWILAAVGLLAIITGIILKLTVFRPLPFGISVYALNSAFYDNYSADTERADSFITAFAEYEGISPEEFRVLMDVTTYISPYRGDNLSMAVDMNLVATAEDGDIDILIANPDLIEFYIVNGFYKNDLEERMSPKLWEYANANDLIYCYHDEATGIDYPLGIKLKNAPKIKELGLYTNEDDPILAFVAYSERTEVARDFADYIFDIK